MINKPKQIAIPHLFIPVIPHLFIPVIPHLLRDLEISYPPPLFPLQT